MKSENGTMEFALKVENPGDSSILILKVDEDILMTKETHAG